MQLKSNVLFQDLIGLSSSGDALISPVTSPTSASSRKRLNVKVDTLNILHAISHATCVVFQAKTLVCCN